MEKFCDYLTPLLYAGDKRKTLRGRVGGADVVIVSYDVLRNEIDFFRAFKFAYCVLDEGHVIKV